MRSSVIITSRTGCPVSPCMARRCAPLHRRRRASYTGCTATRTYRKDPLEHLRRTAAPVLRTKQKPAVCRVGPGLGAYCRLGTYSSSTARSSTRPKTSCAHTSPTSDFTKGWAREGQRALRRTLDHIPGHIPVIGDCKRGDVQPTAASYARAMFDVWGFDAVTVNPYGGGDTVQPSRTTPTGASSCGAGRPTRAPGSSRI